MLVKATDNNPLFIPILLMLLGFSIVGIYYPSLYVPFYLDDRDSIVTNAMVHADSLDLLFNSPFSARLIGYISFWANYQYGGLDPLGYHVVNIAIHLINSFLVFGVSLVFMRHFSSSKTARSRDTDLYWALLITALWALHPLNTQAVTYVVQRLASLVALFYLLAVFSYIQLRQHTFTAKGLAYTVIFLLTLVAGFHTKQNFAAVLLFIACWELFTCSDKIRTQLLRVFVVCIFAVILFSPFITDFWLALDHFTRGPNTLTRSQYFYTQQFVIWDYFKRFIYPLNLQLDIYVIEQKLLSIEVALFLLAHVTVLAMAFRYRKKVPLFFIGILFFYTSHSVESFVFPIEDLAFEHRAYIGNIGLVIALVALLQLFCAQLATRSSGQPSLRFDRQKLASGIVLGTSLVLLCEATITFKRNLLWQDTLAFYANEVRLSPLHPRANASYGTELLKLDQAEQALLYLKKSVDLNLENKRVTASALTSYLHALYKQKLYQKAAAVAMIGLRYVTKPLDKSMLLDAMAVGYIYMTHYDFAKGLLKQAIKLNPSNSSAKTNLAYCLEKSPD